MSETADLSFERVSEDDFEGATLIEGLPGHGMVAAIAVDQIVRQLGLTQFGSVTSDEHFPVVSYANGRIRDSIRVCGKSSPPILTIQSGVAIPPPAFGPLSNLLLEELRDSLERAIFLVEKPAPERDGDSAVSGVASTDELETELEETGIPLDEEGLVVGPTGALASKFAREGVPTVILVVEAGLNPFLPNPSASQTLIEDALEPLVDFDIDTTELEEQADTIQKEMQDLATQFHHVTNGNSIAEATYSSMFQ